MNGSLNRHVAGETLQLIGDRALYWPARGRLLVADLHLGKADVFRRAGIALPRGGTEHDLQRLSALLEATGATALWVLGDLLHGPLPDSHWREAWRQWRSRHAALDLAAVAGNHDRRLASAELGLHLLGETCDDPPFLFCHLPRSVVDRHVVCGHLHPVARVAGMHRRWPAFWLRNDMTVLPAFSAFTGGTRIRPDPGEALVACVEGAAIALAQNVPR